MPSHLTKRETEVVSLIANGKTAKEVATALGISFKTIHCHMARIHWKLGTHKAADLTRYAVGKGLIELMDNEKRYPHYYSTYCIHDDHEHCRKTCKKCCAPCQCKCHKASND